jgi:hypothetical protein
VLDAASFLSFLIFFIFLYLFPGRGTSRRATCVTSGSAWRTNQATLFLGTPSAQSSTSDGDTIKFRFAGRLPPQVSPLADETKPVNNRSRQPQGVK